MLKLLPFLFLVAISAEARDRNGQVSVGAGGGLALESPWADERFRNRVGPGPKLSAMARYHHDSSYSGFELSADYFRQSELDFSSRSLSISFFWRFLPLSKLHPMFSIGLGAADVKNFFTAPDGTQPLYRLRIGAEYEIAENMDLAFHLDQFTMFKRNPRDPNLHVLTPSVSLIAYFGTPPPAVPEAAAAESKTGTPAGNLNLDSDGDGVPDHLDKCPGTPKGQQVNALGCAVKQAFEIKLDVKFATNSSRVQGSTDTALTELARILRENRDLRVELQGHTDSQGAAAKNQRLSQERADEVRRILVNRHGISANRLVARGYGATRPVDTNNTAQGRQNNRRVIARVIR